MIVKFKTDISAYIKVIYTNIRNKTLKLEK